MTEASAVPKAIKIDNKVVSVLIKPQKFENPILQHGS